jgi:hypothetical protein
VVGAEIVIIVIPALGLPDPLVEQFLVTFFVGVITLKYSYPLILKSFGNYFLK